MYHSWDPIYGHMVSISTPRIVSPASLLFKYAQNNDIDGLRTLFQTRSASPFDVNATSGRSALNIAAVARRTEACAFLLQAGSKPDQTDLIFRSPMDVVWNVFIREGSTEANLALLRAFGVDKEEAYEHLQTRKLTPLHQIVMGIYEVDLEKQLAMSAADVNAQDSLGRTPLHWASGKGNAAMTRSLLNAGSSPLVRDYKKQTPIHHCCVTRKGSPSCLKLMLQRAAEMEPYDPFASTETKDYGCLNFASKKTLHSKSVDDNKEYQGRSPLALAAHSDGIKKVELLVTHGADMNIADKEGRTPLLYALFRGSVNSVSHLLDNDAHTDVVDNDHRNILHYAALYGSIQMLELLSAASITHVDISAKDKAGRSPLTTFTELRQPHASAEESKAFHRLLASVKNAQLHEKELKRRFTDESINSSEVEMFFSAAASLEASLPNSMENSMDELKPIPDATVKEQERSKWKPWLGGQWLMGKIAG